MWETAVVGGILGIIWLWTYISFNIGKNDQGIQAENTPIRLLLLLMSLVSVIPLLIIIKIIAGLNDVNIEDLILALYSGYMYVFMFIVFFYVIMFAIQAVNMLRVYKR